MHCNNNLTKHAWFPVLSISICVSGSAESWGGVTRWSIMCGTAQHFQPKSTCTLSRTYPIRKVNNTMPTRMLQFFCTLLHLILGTSISERHHHLRDIPPHATVWGEHFLVDMLQSNAWMKRTFHTKSEQFVLYFRCQLCFLSVGYLSWCCLLCSAPTSKLTSQRLCCGKSWAWTRSWHHHCTAPVKPVREEQITLYKAETRFYRASLKQGIKVYSHLHAIGADDIKGSNHTGDKVDHLVEALVTNAPGPINEEDQICLCASAHWCADTLKLKPNLNRREHPYKYLQLIFQTFCLKNKNRGIKCSFVYLIWL